MTTKEQKQEKINYLATQIADTIRASIAETKKFNKDKVIPLIREILSAKTPKDPNAPKRAPSGYQLFSAEVRNELAGKADLRLIDDDQQSELADMKGKERLSAIAALWREASKEIRAEFEALSDIEKEKYKKELEGYKRPSLESLARTSTEKKPRGRKTKEPGEPSAPHTADWFYVQSVKDEIKANYKGDGKPTATTIDRIAKGQWEMLKSEEKKPFKEQAAKAQEEYKAAMKVFEEAKKKRLQESEDEASGEEESESEDEDEKKKPAKAAKPSKAATKKPASRRTSKESSKKSPQVSEDESSSSSDSEDEKPAKKASKKKTKSDASE